MERCNNKNVIILSLGYGFGINKLIHILHLLDHGRLSHLYSDVQLLCYNLQVAPSLETVPLSSLEPSLLPVTVASPDPSLDATSVPSDRSSYVPASVPSTIPSKLPSSMISLNTCWLPSAASIPKLFHFLPSKLTSLETSSLLSYVRLIPILKTRLDPSDAPSAVPSSKQNPCPNTVLSIDKRKLQLQI